MTSRNQHHGFSLIELMIVVAIIAIIASVTIPKLMAARLQANESAAISTLRSIASAQAQLQSSGAIDTNDDGVGEYGYFGELSGVTPCRVYVSGPNGGPRCGLVGADELNPAFLSTAFGNIMNGQVLRSGYLFQIYLPGTTLDATSILRGRVPGISEDVVGGKWSAPFPDSDNAEVLWCAYAWPQVVTQSGNRCFFINQEGYLLQTPNYGAAAYSGPGGGPNFDAVFSTVGDMASSLGVNGTIAVDRNIWALVQ